MERMKKGDRKSEVAMVRKVNIATFVFALICIPLSFIGTTTNESFTDILNLIQLLSGVTLVVMAKRCGTKGGGGLAREASERGKGAREGGEGRERGKGARKASEGREREKPASEGSERGKRARKASEGSDRARVRDLSYVRPAKRPYPSPTERSERSASHRRPSLCD
jgi:hypothetical protein